MTEIRWQQRFSNYTKAFNHLRNSLQLIQFSDLEKEGVIQRYEYTFEVAWKTLKDFLESEGITSLTGPRSVIKEAFSKEIISNGHAWIDMMDLRNLTTHTYDDEILQSTFEKIKTKYFVEFEQLYNYFKGKL